MKKTVKRAKQLRDEEYGLEEIATMMNKEGFTSQQGFELTMASINNYVINSSGGKKYRSTKQYTRTATKKTKTAVKIHGFCSLKKQDELKTKILSMVLVNNDFNKNEKVATAQILL